MKSNSQNLFEKENQIYLKEKVFFYLHTIHHTFDSSYQDIYISDKSIGTNCKVYFIDFFDVRLSKRIVLKIFGEGRNFPKLLLEEVKRKTLEYQQQLLQCDIFLPFQIDSKNICVERINDEYVLIVLEPLYGNSYNHFDIISAGNTQEIRRIITADMKFILKLRSDVSIRLFDNQEFLLLKSGIDSKPDNFVTHHDTSVYIDLYPPLPIENNKVFYLEDITPYFSSVAWTYLVGTLEGTILRYLKSAEFRLTKPIHIQQFYDYIIDFLANNIPDSSFKYIRNQIENFKFNDINRAYERKF